VHTWNDGMLDGVAIEDNTIYWDPPQTAPAVLNDAEFQGEASKFSNNRIYSTSPWMITSNRSLHFQKNQYVLYSHDGVLGSKWRYDNRVFQKFTDYQGKSGQDAAGGFRQVAATHTDSIFGIEAGKGLPEEDVTYHVLLSQPLIDVTGHAIGHRMLGDAWTVYAILPAELDARGLLKEMSYRQLVFLKSLHTQFHGNGLKMVIALRNVKNPSAKEDLANVISDLGFKSAVFAYMQTAGTLAPEEPLTLLLSPEGHVAKAWHGIAGASDLGIAVRQRLGSPAYSQIGEDAQ
jgi:hypothetical protein